MAFLGSGELVRHMMIHNEEKPYTCSHCEKCFLEKSQLQDHTRNHIGDKIYQCSYCDKTFILCLIVN